jgi:hypothetical protein
MAMTIGYCIGRPPKPISKIGIIFLRRVKNSKNPAIPETSQIT